MPIHLDLFSGIGGFALAAQSVGIQTVQFCEKDKFCKELLEKRFPGIPIHTDINDYEPITLRPFLVTAGFPCQPFSQAGQQQGDTDPRYLWPQTFRAIQLSRPSWVILENVPGIIPLALDTVLADLEGCGYSWRALCIPACAVGAPHIRERLWVIAHANGQRWQGTGQAESTRRCLSPRADTNRDPIANIQGEWLQQLRRQQLSKGSTKKGSLPNWEAKSPVQPVADGVPNRVARLRAIGNAIVPQIAAQLMTAILISEFGSNNQ